MSKMTAVYVRRCLKLVRFLRKLKPSKFYIGSFSKDAEGPGVCGTVCCALGWCPEVFPTHWSYHGWTPAINNRLGGFNSASRFFGMPSWRASHIFGTSGYEEDASSVTPDMVADRLETHVHELRAKKTGAASGRRRPRSRARSRVR